MSDFIKLTIETTDTVTREVLVNALFEGYNAEGVEESDNEIQVFFDVASFNKIAVDALLKAENLPYKWEDMPQQNWNAIWENDFKPVIVGDFVGIRAAFHSPLQNVQHELVITPKMSFGTGHHATTVQMVLHMQHLDFKGKTVADYGTGTGILAILADKLGAAKVLGIDYDDWCIENATENVVTNNAAVAIVKDDHFSTGQTWDIVLANINLNILTENLSSFYKETKHGGILIISGILHTDETIFSEKLKEAGWKVKLRTERNNWLCITLCKG